MSIFSAKKNCYCAFCKTPRRVYRKKSISFLNAFASGAAAAVFMMLMWQQWDPRSIVVFVVCLAISEAFVKIRWRLSMVCRQCGFDPILYIKDVDAASLKVREHLDRRKQDPRYLLSKPLNLPAISAEKAKALQNKDKKGSLVSRSV
ncbi:hypothetical protein D3C72_1174050 [compost metagenome]